MTLGKVVQASIERRLDELGEFSPREGAIPTGLPDEVREGTIIRVNVSIDEGVAEQWRDALYWKSLYLSHATEEAIREFLKAST